MGGKFRNYILNIFDDQCYRLPRFVYVACLFSIPRTSHTHSTVSRAEETGRTDYPTPIHSESGVLPFIEVATGVHCLG